MNIEVIKSLIEEDKIVTPCYVGDADILTAHIQMMKDIMFLFLRMVKKTS